MKFLRNILLFLLLSTVVGQVRAAHVFAVYQVLSGYPETTFFIHGDHLGSDSWITDEYGEPVQYIHYAPYGELLANQQAIGYDERYKFTGKERDAESNYDNFGARYYWSDLDFWTRVDPLADNYISTAPYMYCAGNPIVLKDPDGKMPQVVIGAVVSAATDYAVQVGMNMLSGDNFSTALTHNIDMKSIMISAATGAIGVGALTNIKRAAHFYGLGKTSTQIITETSAVLVDIGTSTTEQILKSGDVKMDQMMIDVVAGRLGDGAGKAVTGKLKKTNIVRCLENKIDRLERLTSSSSPKASRQNILKTTQNELEQTINNPSQAASSATQKAVSKVVENLTE